MDSRFSSQCAIFQQWINTGLPTRFLQKETRACFTIWAHPDSAGDSNTSIDGADEFLESVSSKDLGSSSGKLAGKGNRSRPLAWIAIPLYNSRDQLLSGSCELSLWKCERWSPGSATPPATPWLCSMGENLAAAHPSVLHIEADVFCAPVQYQKPRKEDLPPPSVDPFEASLPMADLSLSGSQSRWSGASASSIPPPLSASSAIQADLPMPSAEAITSGTDFSPSDSPAQVNPLQMPDKSLPMSPPAQQNVTDLKRLHDLVALDPLYELNPDDKRLLWQMRQSASTIPGALPKFALAVDWHDPSQALEAQELIEHWAKPGREDDGSNAHTMTPFEHTTAALNAMVLLEAQYPQTSVRQYAVSMLEHMSDNDLCNHILQLTEVLKYEPHHSSLLSRFLIRRSIRNFNVIGHQFFWMLIAQMHSPTTTVRFGLQLEEYVLRCGSRRTQLIEQREIVRQLVVVAEGIKRIKGEAKRLAALRKNLALMKLPERFSLPLSMQYDFKGLIVDKCKFMDSKKLPLWLVFEQIEPEAPPVPIMFKSGDDLRQDQLTLQLIGIMDKLWLQHGLDLLMTPYMCISTGDEIGFIEIVQNSQTFSNIHKASGISMAAFSHKPINDWLEAECGGM